MDDSWEQIKALASPVGAELLARAARLAPDRLTRLQALRRDTPVRMSAAAVEMLELRKRAKGKFARADRMFFTREGLEQATGEVIARYRATRFPVGAPLLDACCGIGSDALALAERGPVLGVERNPALMACASANVRRCGTQHPIALICADVTAIDLDRLRLRGFTAAFFDPSRRADASAGGRRRVHDAEHYAPPLSWLRALTERFGAVGAKVSPAIDDDALARTGACVEFISERGECKEAALWYGEAAASLIHPADCGEVTGYFATVLKSGSAPTTLTPAAVVEPPVTALSCWLYEPDPAVVRAHLVGTLAERLCAAPLALGIAYLTADCCAPTPFATAYRILDAMPFNLKHLQKWLRRAGRRVEVVKRRGTPLDPDEMRRRLDHADLRDAPSIVLVLTRIEGRAFALLCDLPVRDADELSARPEAP